MNQWSHLTQQIVDALSDVPATECGRLLAYALAIKYNIATSKGEDYGTAREIAMTLFQVSDEDLFQVVAEAYAQSSGHSEEEEFDY